MKIELHKQFRVPIDGLIPMAEEIVVQKEQKAKQNATSAFKVAESKAPADDEETPEGANGEPITDRKALKKLTKQENREKRKLKKELKDLEKQIKDNKKKKILSQDEVWELEDRIAVLKEKIGEKK